MAYAIKVDHGGQPLWLTADLEWGTSRSLARRWLNFYDAAKVLASISNAPVSLRDAVIVSLRPKDKGPR